MIVRETIVIQQSPADVFEYVSRYANDANWRSEVIDMTCIQGVDGELGSRTVETAKVVGRTLTTTTDVTELVPGQKIVSTVIKGQTPGTFTRIVEPVNGGSRLTYELDVDLSGSLYFRMMSLPLRGYYQRKVAGYLAMLKGILEGNE